MSSLTLLQLPLDVLVNIMKYLTLKDLRNIMLTCKTLLDFVRNDNSIWRSINRNKLIVHNRSGNRQNVTLSWYNLSRISHNWCKGIYRNKVVISHHTNYMPWITLHNSEALVLSVGSELRCYATDRKGFPYCKDTLWKLEVPTVKRKDVRTNDISRFVIRDQHIVCGNRDGCVAVYELCDIKHRPRLLHHIRDCHENGLVEVTDVQVISNKAENMYVVTSSNYSPKLHFWCCTSEEIIQNDLQEIYLSGCVGVRCLAINRLEDKLAIGLNGNNKPLLLDVTTGQLLMGADATRNTKQAVRDIAWHNENTVVYVTHSGMLQLIDIRTNEIIYDTMDPFHSTLYCVKSDGRHAIVVGSSEYSRCVLFDLRRCAHHAQMYFTQKKSSPVYSLDFDSTKLIAATDRSVATLNFNIKATAVLLRDYSLPFKVVNNDI